MTTVQREQLLACVKGLLRSEKYSDLIIICGPDTYHAHKNIVCARCGFFERADTFAVSREAADSKIDLPDDDPIIIKLLIQYLYEAEYPPALPFLTYPSFPHTCPDECAQRICAHHTCNNLYVELCCQEFSCKPCEYESMPKGDEFQMLVHAKMYELGDKYDVTGLKELARDKFQRSCRVLWNTEQFGVAA